MCLFPRRRSDLVAASEEFKAVGVELRFLGDVGGLSGLSGLYVEVSHGLHDPAARLARGGDQVSVGDIDDDSVPVVEMHGNRHLIFPWRCLGAFSVLVGSRGPAWRWNRGKTCTWNLALSR